MNKTLRIFNGFGIMPTNTYISAGTDYYFPIIDCKNSEMYSRAVKAFQKSYSVSETDINEILYMLSQYIDKDRFDIHSLNILHLYLCLGSRTLEDIRVKNGNIDGYFIEDICYFCDNYLTWDSKDNPGIIINYEDTLFVNSGIKIALNPNDAGLYVNKSGMGNKGWDIRACLVDEDYSGYVHLSMAFTRNTRKVKPRTIICGDKLTQMMIVEVKHYNISEVNETEYINIMANSERGDNGFGHSDIKH